MRHRIENGTLFIDAGEPYLEHHGVLGMKWGKHLRAGKGPASAPASALSEGARQEQTAYEKSLAGKYDKMKADRERKRKMKRRKMIEDAFRTKHSDDTDAIYTEGTRLVITSKWG